MVNQLWRIDGILAQAGEIPWNYILAGLGALAGLLFAIFFITFGSLWLQAKASGCPISLVQFIGMFLRKNKTKLIVNSLIITHKAGGPDTAHAVSMPSIVALRTCGSLKWIGPIAAPAPEYSLSGATTNTSPCSRIERAST